MKLATRNISSLRAHRELERNEERRNMERAGIGFSADT